MFYQPINFARWFKFLLVGKKGTRNVLIVAKKIKFEPCKVGYFVSQHTMG